MNIVEVVVVYYQDMVVWVGGFDYYFCQGIDVGVLVGWLDVGFCYFCYLLWNMLWLQEEYFIGVVE